MSFLLPLKRLLGFAETPRQAFASLLTQQEFDRALVAVSADPTLRTAKDDDGRTVLSEMAAIGLTPAVQWLLANQFSPDTRDDDGASPLHSATVLMATDICTLLLDAGADVNAMDDLGQTPLHWAAEVGATAVCQLLIDRGVIVHKKNHDGLAAIDIIDITLDDNGTTRALLEAAAQADG